MKEEYKRLIDRSISKQKQYRKLIRSFDQQKPKVVHEAFFEADEAAFQEINCLNCANCCKTVGPRFKASEIKRLSKYKGMDELSFKDQYLKIDGDGDFVLQQTPCLFLNEDNTCEVYDIRPEACADFPHTQRPDIKKHLKLTLKNSRHCPAVATVFEKLAVKKNKGN